MKHFFIYFQAFNLQHYIHNDSISTVYIHVLYVSFSCIELNGTRLYENGERLFLDTLNKLILDPFNKIQGCEHGKTIISLADCLLKNKCDMKKYNSILGKLWKAATAGDTRKLPTTQRDKM